MTNENRQVWILTTYGINRITEAMQSPSTERLYLTNIKVGDANGTYYVPVQGTDNDLKHKIVIDGSYASFPITQKSVSGNVVTFKSFISETSGGYDIREIGLYETIDGIDYCFAIGTCEPIVKPAYTTDDNYGYAMSIDYTLNIDSVNLASVYSQIELDSDNESVTKTELEALSRTVLFVEGNLMDQISINTHLLGLNRAQQLSELIDSTRYAYANSALTSLYANLLNSTASSNIRGFWGFNYTERYDSTVAVKDFSTYGNNLSLNKQITNYETDTFSLAPYINFQTLDYFYAPYVSSLKMSTAFTLLFTGQLNAINVNNTILAQANPYTGVYNWIVQIDTNGAIVVKVYTDANNYRTYQTADSVIPAGVFTLAITYSSTGVKVYLNNNELTTTLTTTGTFSSLAQNNLETTSYLLNSSGVKSDNINAKVCFLSLLSTALDEKYIRAMSLNLMALTGKNIYRGE